MPFISYWMLFQLDNVDDVNNNSNDVDDNDEEVFKDDKKRKKIWTESFWWFVSYPGFQVRQYFVLRLLWMIMMMMMKN